MPLANRALGRPHSVRAFRAAAGARYREAVRLAVSGHRLGAIYLYGYVAEMLLKAAYFRVRGWGLTQPITPRDLSDAWQQRAIKTYHLKWRDKLHDLTGWTRLLAHERRVLGRPFPRAFRNQLLARVNLIYRNWRESLRYHDMRPYARELDGTRKAVNWLLARYRRL